MRTAFYFMLVALMLPFISVAQKKKKGAEPTFLELSDVRVDADLSEWRGQFFNPDSEFWQYAIATDQGNLCAAVKILDKELVLEALRNGILLNLSYNAKKAEGAQLVYPGVDAVRLRALAQDESLTIDSIPSALLASTKGYQIKGFSKVIDGLLSFDNEYGIKAAAALDSAGSLLFEAQVPLDLVKFKSDAIMVQLAVQTQFMRMKRAMDQRRQSSNMGIYGIYRPSSPSIKSPYPEDPEVWVKGNIKQN